MPAWKEAPGGMGRGIKVGSRRLFSNEDKWHRNLSCDSGFEAEREICTVQYFVSAQLCHGAAGGRFLRWMDEI